MLSLDSFCEIIREDVMFSVFLYFVFISSTFLKSSAKVIHFFLFFQLCDTQSFAQKLQLRVPSMESLFRSPVKESIFRSSSKESLVRTSSRDSLNRLDIDTTSPTFDPPSDVESEAEELLGNMDSLSKEQLLQRLRRMERSLGNYRGKYTEVRKCFLTSLKRGMKRVMAMKAERVEKIL